MSLLLGRNLRKMLLSLTTINARLASIGKGIPYTEADMEKIYTCLEMLTIHTISPLLHPPSTLEKC